MYKTILVHVDETAHSAQRVAVAARLALQYDGHLVGAAMTGFAAGMLSYPAIDPGVPAIVFPLDELRTRAGRALDQFERQAREAGVRSIERRLHDEDAAISISMQSRYSDLVVISQVSPDEYLPRLRSDFPEFVLLNSARPVLVMPSRPQDSAPGRRVTVAWNGSSNALRAITSAVPLLQRAEQVSLVVFDAEGATGDNAHGDDPGVDMAAYLARHGIVVEVGTAHGGSHTGDALLSYAADRQSDLIVMGAYGHSRFSEIMLGGATRTALQSSPVALWMAH
jgi:nucleotide-binding universal stress UspA family protein